MSQAGDPQPAQPTGASSDVATPQVRTPAAEAPAPFDVWGNHDISGFPEDVGPTNRLFGAESAQASVPPPPVRVCPTADGHFSETAVQRVSVRQVHTPVPSGDKVRLGLSLLCLFGVLLAFLLPATIGIRLLLIAAGLVGALAFLRGALPATMKWLGLTGRVEGRFAHSFVHRSCPKCGRELEDACKGCGKWLIDAEESFCWNCGIKYWWAVLREESGKERLDDWKSRSHKLIDGGSSRTLWTLVCSITQVPVDAVVSTDTIDGLMKGEAAVHLFAMGGRGIEVDSKDAVEGRDGTEKRRSWITRAGTLPAGHVIHLPLVGIGLDAGDVEAAVLDVLGLAADEKLKSIALPLLGTGRGEMTPEVATLEIYRAVEQWRSEPPTSVKDVIVIFREEDEAVRFREVVRKADSAKHDHDVESGEAAPDGPQS